MKKQQTFEDTCPLCGHELERKEQIGLEIKLEELIENRTSKKIAELKQQIEEERKTKQDDLKSMEERIQKIYDGQKQEQKDFFEEQIKKQKTISEEQTKSLKKDLDETNKKISEKAAEMAKSQIEAERKEKEMAQEQLKRTQEKLDEAKASSTGISGELKGTVGEASLLELLNNAFASEGDRLVPIKRGQKGPDILHYVVGEFGEFPSPIIYDNKEDKIPDEKDIKKIKEYKAMYNTNYAIIVSIKLPKKIENGKMGEKDGVLIVHRDIISEYVRQLRKSLVDIQKTSVSSRDREKKEAKLFDYLKGQEFERNITEIETDLRTLDGVQKDEEKDHQKMWELRKRLLQQIAGKRLKIDSKITSFLRDTKEPMQFETPLLSPIIVKKKKKIV